MSNVKVLPSDPFVMNCKMLFNDLAAMQDRVRRMWASADGDRDMALLEVLEIGLGNISSELRHRLDN